MKRRNRKADDFPNLFAGAEEETPAAEDVSAEENFPESAEEVSSPAGEEAAAEPGGAGDAAQPPAEQAEEPAAQPDAEEPAEAPGLSEREEEAGTEEYSGGEDTRVIEDTTEGGEEGKKYKRGRVKEPMPRKKKIIIGVIAGVLAVAVLVAVVVPVSIFFTNNLTVSSAEDLLAVDWNNLGGKNVYLQKDVTVDGDLEIPSAAVINLNKHSLTVNGALKITGDVSIGTVSGDSFSGKGGVSVNSLQVNSSGGLQLYADTIVGEGTVAAGVFRTDCALTLNGVLAINAESAYIEGAVTGGENARLVFTGGVADVTGGVQTAMAAENGAYVSVENSAAGIALDGQSYLVLSGSASSVTGGKGVLALKNFSCSVFTGMERLGVYVQSCAGGERFEDIDDIFFIEKLDAPAAAQVDIRGDRIVLTISDVEHSADADFSYRVTVNDTVFESVSGTELDITEAVTTAGVYDILITAQGNFKTGENGRYDIDSFTKDVYYIDSNPCGIRYEHTFTLSTPDNLHIDTVDGGITLHFDAVPFADGYNVYINNSQEPVYSEKNEVSISSDLLNAGSNAIYVQAVSGNEQIHASSRALIGYVKYEKLATPAVEAPVISGNEVAVGWTKTDNSPARIFEVVFTYNSAQGGVTSKTVYTTANTITVTLDDLADGSCVSVGVRALGYGYYLTGDAGTRNAETRKHTERELSRSFY